LFWPAAADNKKPTAVSSRGFLSKFSSVSTSADGVVSYDDGQNNDLSNQSEHCALRIRRHPGRVKSQSLVKNRIFLRRAFCAKRFVTGRGKICLRAPASFVLKMAGQRVTEEKSVFSNEMMSKKLGAEKAAQKESHRCLIPIHSAVVGSPEVR